MRIAELGLPRPFDLTVGKAMAGAARVWLSAVFAACGRGRVFRVVRSTPAAGGFDVTGEIRGLVLNGGEQRGCELCLMAARAQRAVD